MAKNVTQSAHVHKSSWGEMSGNYLINGILIGLLFGIPAGTGGALTVQRTLNYGIKAELATGLGSSVADCIYACIGTFGMTLISHFLFKYQTVINILGSGLILAMGIRMMLKKSENSVSGVPALGSIKMFLSSFMVGITNSTAILTFLFAFSFFGISGQLTMFQGIQLVCGVFIETYIWWGILSVAANALKKKANSFCKLNRVFGIILPLFGTAIFARAIL